jgi:hypothetical protein
MDNEKKEQESNEVVSEIIRDDEAMSLDREDNRAAMVGDGKLDLRKGGNIVIGTINIVAEPVKKHLKGRHERFYKDGSFHLWADAFFVLVILGLFSVFLIAKNLEPKPEIELISSFVGESAVSGDLSTFEISYRNNRTTDVDNASLSLTFPKNFQLVSVQPEASFSDQTNTFLIGDLPRGANGKIKVSGSVIGSMGESQSLAYSLNYLFKGKKYNTLGSLMYSVGSSAFSAVLEMPDRVYEGVNFGGKIVIKNSGKIDLNRNLEIVLDGDSVKFVSVSGQRVNLLNGVAVWDALRAGETAEIEFEASSSIDKAGDISLSVYADVDGIKAKQFTVKKPVFVLSPKFKTLLNTDNKWMRSGEPAAFNLSLENGESVVIKDIRLNIASADSAFVLKELKLAEGDGYSISGTILSVPSMDPGKKLDIALEAVLERKRIDPNQDAGLAADVYYIAGDDPRDYRIYGQKMKVVSDLQVSSRAVYYSAQGDQLGVGPLPPAVDIPTRYWVFLEADNLGNDLKDFMVSAELPANVGWTEQKSLLSGKIRYAPIGHKVVWTVDEMSKDGGQYRAGFEIELIPNKTDLGTVPKILIKTEYSAFDMHAGVEVSGALEDLSADLKGDNLASGKGKVIKLEIVK